MRQRVAELAALEKLMQEREQEIISLEQDIINAERRRDDIEARNAWKQAQVRARMSEKQEAAAPSSQLVTTQEVQELVSKEVQGRMAPFAPVIASVEQHMESLRKTVSKLEGSSSREGTDPVAYEASGKEWPRIRAVEQDG
jgi:chromosome segregation ATPase